jgi:hypothetical protein
MGRLQKFAGTAAAALVVIVLLVGMMDRVGGTIRKGIVLVGFLWIGVGADLAV